MRKLVLVILTVLLYSCAAPEVINNANIHFNEGLSHLEKGENNQAISDFSKAIKSDPAPIGDYHHHRGIAYYNLGLYDQAISDYTKSMEINSGGIRPAVYYNLGLSYHRQGNYDKAMDNFIVAMEEHKGNYVQRLQGLGYTFHPAYLEKLDKIFKSGNDVRYSLALSLAMEIIEGAPPVNFYYMEPFGLSNSQLDDIHDIYREYSYKNRKLRNPFKIRYHNHCYNSSDYFNCKEKDLQRLSNRSLKKKIKSLRNEKDAKIKKVLSNKQYKQYKLTFPD